MESTATTRNEAQAIQSDIMSRIAAIGVTSLAGAIGVDKSQVSRWQSKGGWWRKRACFWPLPALSVRKPC